MAGNVLAQEAQSSFQDTRLIAGHLKVDPVLLRDDADFAGAAAALRVQTALTVTASRGAVLSAGCR